MNNLTPEKLANLRRSAESWAMIGAESIIPLLDERDALAKNQDILIGSVNHYKANRDALAAKLEAVRMAAQTGTPTNPHAWADGYAEAMTHILGVLDNTDLHAPKNCCCRWGSAVSGEYPEFGCAKCAIHQGGLGETDLCRRHRQSDEADILADL